MGKSYVARYKHTGQGLVPHSLASVPDGYYYKGTPYREVHPDFVAKSTMAEGVPDYIVTEVKDAAWHFSQSGNSGILILAILSNGADKPELYETQEYKNNLALLMLASTIERWSDYERVQNVQLPPITDEVIRRAIKYVVTVSVPGTPPPDPKTHMRHELNGYLIDIRRDPYARVAAVSPLR